MLSAPLYSHLSTRTVMVTRKDGPAARPRRERRGLGKGGVEDGPVMEQREADGGV
jgi:hypothetical protein